MTKVTISKDKEGHIYGFKFEGHACYAEYGKDIVCSGISMAAQMTIVSLNQIFANLDVQTGDGFLEFNFFDFRSLTSVGLVCRTLELVLKDLEEQYPENLHVLTC